MRRSGDVILYVLFALSMTGLFVAAGYVDAAYGLVGTLSLVATYYGIMRASVSWWRGSRARADHRELAEELSRGELSSFQVLRLLRGKVQEHGCAWIPYMATDLALLEKKMWAELLEGKAREMRRSKHPAGYPVECVSCPRHLPGKTS